MRGIDGSVALVTGAACPPEIGRATAVRLAAHGARVVCAERIVDPSGDLPDSGGAARAALDRTVASVVDAGGEAIAVELDPSSEASVDAAFEAAVERYGRVDLVAHVCGGLGPRLGWGPLIELDVASWQANADLNLTGAWLIARAAARQMIEQGDGGAIAFLSSYAAHTAATGSGAFGVAKAGVDRLTSALASELADDRIRVNAVRPLGVDPAATTSGHPYLDATREAAASGGSTWVEQRIALGRLQHPDETAAVLEFLLSDEASFVTGQRIDTAGGSAW